MDTFLWMEIGMLWSFERLGSSKVLVGVLMIAIVISLAGTLISLNTLGKFDFTSNSLTGASGVNKNNFKNKKTTTVLESDNETLRN